MSLTRRVLTVCAAAIAALVVLAGPASAHAELVASTPSQGAVVRSEPTQVALRFSEEIVLRLSAVKVIGPDGRRLDTGTPHAGPFGASSMAVDLAPEARHGTFVVVWQATAADDGHASSGQVQFSVGAPSAAVSVAGLGHNRLTSAVYDAGQWVGFAGLAMVGGVAALYTYRRRGLPRGDGSPIEYQAPGTDTNHAETTAAATAVAGATELDTDDSRAELQPEGTAASVAAPGSVPAPRAPSSIAATSAIPTRAVLQPEGTAAIATTSTTEPEPSQPAAPASAPTPTSIPTWPAALGWSLLLIGTLIQVTAYAPAARGLPLTHLLDRSLLSVTLGTREGHAFMARLVVLAVAAVVGDAVLRRATGPGLPLAFTLAVAATWGATGHAATGGGAGVAMVALTLHVAAMAVWVGGLFVVAVLLAGGGGAVAGVVRRFSRLALGAVGLLVATGLYQGWREVGSVSGLVDTTYGRLLLAKVAVLLCVIGVARGSRGIVAKWRDNSDGDSGSRSSAAALRRNVAIELAGASVLLLLAVLLAGNAPPR